LPDIKLFLLGSPRVELDGNPVDLDTRKAVALLAYLAVTGEGRRRETLAVLLWPDYDHPHAMGALRRTLSSIRKTLGERSLEVSREKIAIPSGHPIWTDYGEFQQLLTTRKEHGHPSNEVCPSCMPLLYRAVKLYRDHFMAGFSLRDSSEFDDWQFFQAETLRKAYSEALELMVQAELSNGDIPSAISHAQRWLAQDLLHEPAHRQLMQLYSWSGQRNAALRQYQECMKILMKELGVEPLEETTELYKLIKENRLPELEIGTPIYGRQVRPESPPTRNQLAFEAPFKGNFPLVGRQHEWQLLEDLYQSIRRDGHFAVLQGEPGIGKTRLAEEHLDRLRAGGTQVLTVRCYQEENNLAYGPFMEALRAAIEIASDSGWIKRVQNHWLSEAARLAPELFQISPGLTPAPSLEGPGAQTRFFEGLYQVFLAACGSDRAGVIFFDDLHWSDEASLDLLTYLVRRLRGRPIFLLATWRGEDVGGEHRLRRLLAEAQRAGWGTLIPLKPLTPNSVTELVRTIFPTAQASSAELSQRLYSETDGLPFFVVEYLRSLPVEAGYNPDANWDMPGSVRDLLRSRLANIRDTEIQLLQTASIIGRSFDYETLKGASGRSDEETVGALEILLRRGLLREIPGGSAATDGADLHHTQYDFTHEKIRDFVQSETSHARRSILHRRIADTLSSPVRSRRDVEAMAGVIGQHYQSAGRPLEAAEFYRLAGEYSRSLYANSEALTNFCAALELGHPQPAALHESIADLQTLSGNYASAQTNYTASIDLSGDFPETIARLQHKLGNLHDRHGNWELAEKHFQNALDSLGTRGSAGEAARIYADWSLTAHRQGRTDQAADFARRAQELAERGDDQHALAQAHNILGILARSQGDFQMAQVALQRSLTLSQALGDSSARIAALNNLALVSGSQGDIDRALELTREALQLCKNQGDRHREAALHNNLADLLYLKGQSEAAMSHLKQAVAIFAEIGVVNQEGQTGIHPGSYQPEIWKLSEW
jgi:predicted ATPase/DNA-binding SARP family transcriptional activator